MRVRTLTDLLEQVDVSEEADVSAPVMCASLFHVLKGLPAHRADWWASYPCGRRAPLCDARRSWCFREGALFCGSGCGRQHPVTEIWWEPV